MAAATTIYKFRVYCSDESQYKYTWSDIVPTTCPSNSSHQIDANSITVVDQISTTQVQIKEESTPTGGNFGATSVKFTANPGLTTYVKKFNYPISALSTTFTTGSAHTGDMINLVAGKDTLIGIIVSPLDAITQWEDGSYVASDTVYHEGFNYYCINETSEEPSADNQNWKSFPTNIIVSSSVMAYSALGYHIALTDGVHLDRLDEIIAIDKINNTLTLFGATANSYKPTAYTLISMYYFNKLHIDLPMTHEVGSKKMGGTYTPANTPIAIEYYNNSSDAKTFVGRVEYIY